MATTESKTDLVDDKLGSSDSVELDEIGQKDSESKPGRISYDEALRKYGTGKYQILLLLPLMLVTWSTVFNNNGYIFIGASQNHTCQVPNDTYSNQTADQGYNIRYVADTCSYDKIAYYHNGTNITLEEKVKCSSWDYDQSEFTLTIMSEWNLNSCDGKWLISLASSMYMVGFFIGCIVLADLADRFGRSKILLISNIFMIAAGVAASFSVNLEMLIVMRLLLGIFTAGARNAGYVYVCEIFENRAVAGMLHGVVYGVGGVVVTAISQLLPNWRHFQLCCACVYALYIPYYWIMPESPRWKLSQGDNKDANKYFVKSARINKVEMSGDVDTYLENKTKKEGTVLTLFKTPNVRKKTLIVCVAWFSVSIVYFGMSFNVGNIGGNIFVNNYLLQASGTLQFIGIWYVELGRRNAICSAFLIACVVSGLIPVLAIYGTGAIVEGGLNVAVIVLSMVGKLLFDSNFGMIYIATAEIYPTTARVTALGLGSALARLGGALAPYVVLTNDYWPNMPYIIFGVLSLIAGLITVKLPETKGKPILDSLQQVENETPLSPFFCCQRPAADAGDQEKSEDMLNTEKA